MTFGLQVFNADGHLGYSSDDVTWNQADFFYVPPYGSVAQNIPAIVGRQVLTVQMFINPPPSDRKATAHAVSVSGAVVSASGGSEAAYILVLTR